MAVFGASNALTYNSASAGVLPDVSDQPMATIGPTVPLSPLVAWLAVVAAYLATFVATAVALRTFVSDETRRFPREYLTRHVGWFLVNYVVFPVAATMGVFHLVVPGFFLLVSRYFQFVHVAVEDQSFVEGSRNSWTLTNGNRWGLTGSD